ncbi:UNVERIFIED_CONTAM: endodeoxyribonuclease, partial [Siphonaria sp. JEL0065]
MDILSFESDSVSASDVSCLNSLLDSDEDSDSEREQALDVALLSATGTHLPLANHHVLKRLQAHLDANVKLDSVVFVRIGSPLDEQVKKGDPICISARNRFDLAVEIQAVLTRIATVSKNLEFPALSLIARDDSVWSYNPETKSTILKCDPLKIWRTVKCDSPRFNQIVKCLEITLDLLKTNKTATKRDIYYRHVTLFKRQSNVDDIIESLACSLRVPRHCLHILASPKGLLKGPLRIHTCPTSSSRIQSTTTADIRNNSKTGTLIPLVSQISGIEYIPSTSITNTTRYPTNPPPPPVIKILVIEKEATFTGILCEINSGGTASDEPDDMDHEERQDWVLVTGKGYPDKNTQEFVNLLSRAEFRWGVVGGGSGRMGWCWSVGDNGGGGVALGNELEMMDTVPDVLMDSAGESSDDEVEERKGSWLGGVSNRKLQTLPPDATSFMNVFNSDFDIDDDEDDDEEAWFSPPETTEAAGDSSTTPTTAISQLARPKTPLPLITKIYGLFD